MCRRPREVLADASRTVGSQDWMQCSVLVHHETRVILVKQCVSSSFLSEWRPSHGIIQMTCYHNLFFLPRNNLMTSTLNGKANFIQHWLHSWFVDQENLGATASQAPPTPHCECRTLYHTLSSRGGTVQYLPVCYIFVLLQPTGTSSGRGSHSRSGSCRVVIHIGYSSYKHLLLPQVITKYMLPTSLSRHTEGKRSSE